MARKPIELERAGMHSPSERVWNAARKLRVFTIEQLQDATKPLVQWPTCEDYVKSLHKAGYLELHAGGKRVNNRFAAATYKLARDVFDAPRFGTGSAPVTQGMAVLAMWRAMKVLGEFDYHDIQRAASLGDACVVRPLTAKKYVMLLAKAGYFRTVRASKPGTAARYKMLRDTGAHAPAITRRKCVFDRNLGAFTWQQTEQEVCDGLE